MCVCVCGWVRACHFGGGSLLKLIAMYRPQTPKKPTSERPSTISNGGCVLVAAPEGDDSQPVLVRADRPKSVSQLKEIDSLRFPAGISMGKRAPVFVGWV